MPGYLGCHFLYIKCVLLSVTWNRLTVSVMLGSITSAEDISHLPQMLFNLRVLLENWLQHWQIRAFQDWAPVLKAAMRNVSKASWTHSHDQPLKAQVHVAVLKPPFTSIFDPPHMVLVLAQIKELKSDAVRTGCILPNSLTMRISVTCIHLQKQISPTWIVLSLLFTWAINLNTLYLLCII